MAAGKELGPGLQEQAPIVQSEVVFVAAEVQPADDLGVVVLAAKRRVGYMTQEPTQEEALAYLVVAHSIEVAQVGRAWGF